MKVFVNHIELDISHCFSYGDPAIESVNLENRTKDGTLRRTIAIVEICFSLYRLYRSHLFTGTGQVLERRNSGRGIKLPCHLSGHDRMSDLVAIEPFFHSHQIQSQLLLNDIDTSTTCKRGICIHHDHIKTKACVSG